ncbi:MAG: RluA family pseudouridine synthase [Clostridia bacterium]|nr:RluA family pseudouridine synthase [Clostridia bacterium]
MKRYTFTIPSDARPGRLLPLAGRMLPEVPEYILREAFRKRDVKINGQRAGMDASVVPGAAIQIYARETETKAIDIPVIYEDENVLVAVKPAGVSCDEDSKGGKTLPQLLETAERGLPLLCHRLDNPTEGLVILAKSEEVQQLMQDAFRARQVHKTYTCLVKGTPKPAHRLMEDYLLKDARHAQVRVVSQPRPGAKVIATEYTVLKAGECARCRIELHTGRTHQIRAHMAFIGHPLLGDDLYGDRMFNREYKCRKLMLCSSELSFSLEGKLSYLNQKHFSCKPTF